MMTAEMKRRRSERLEIRTTPEDRALIDRAVAETNSDLTEFAISNLTMAARRILADRTEFRLTPEAFEAWQALNDRPARELPSIVALMQRPSPFYDA